LGVLIRGGIDMKIALTSSGRDLKSGLDPRFGRCAYFMVVDGDSMDYEIIENTGLKATGGAGIQSAQRMLDQGVQVVITGNIGPNAMRVLNSGGIDVYIGAGGSLEEVITQFKAGELTKVNSPTVDSHSGLGM
jgi:predicted Fe-Mo cluster-binding NifX family protein